MHRLWTARYGVRYLFGQSNPPALTLAAHDLGIIQMAIGKRMPERGVFDFGDPQRRGGLQPLRCVLLQAPVTQAFFPPRSQAQDSSSTPYFLRRPESIPR